MRVAAPMAIKVGITLVVTVARTVTDTTSIQGPGTITHTMRANAIPLATDENCISWRRPKAVRAFAPIDSDGWCIGKIDIRRQVVTEGGGDGQQEQNRTVN
jgi:hypothetical protein